MDYQHPTPFATPENKNHYLRVQDENLLLEESQKNKAQNFSKPVTNHKSVAMLSAYICDN